MFANLMHVSKLKAHAHVHANAYAHSHMDMLAGMHSTSAHMHTDDCCEVIQFIFVFDSLVGLSDDSSIFEELVCQIVVVACIFLHVVLSVCERVFLHVDAQQS